MGTFIKYFFLVGLCLFLTSYSFNKKNSGECKFLTKIDSLDLSNKGLDSIPDLSCAKIDYLNLSNNNITFYDESKLPNGLKELNLSNNKIRERLTVRVNLEKINLSQNKIEILYISKCIKYVDVSYNDLVLIGSYCSRYRKGEYLNISNNKSLSSILALDPRIINKIDRNNIKDNNELRWHLSMPIH